MAENVLDVVPGAGIAMTEGSGTDQGKLFISALNNGSVYYGSYNGDNTYNGPETNSYFFLTYYVSGAEGRTVNYTIFVKSNEQISVDPDSTETNDYIVTYYPINPSVTYVLVGTGKVPKTATIDGTGTLLVNITSWTKTSTEPNNQD